MTEQVNSLEELGAVAEGSAPASRDRQADEQLLFTGGGKDRSSKRAMWTKRRSTRSSAASRPRTPG